MFSFILFTVVFTLLAAGCIFIAIEKIKLNKKVFGVLIPAYIMFCLYVYSSLIGQMGYPSKDVKILANVQFQVINVVEIEKDVLILTIFEQGKTRPRMFEIKDPKGEVRKKISETQRQINPSELGAGDFEPMDGRIELDNTVPGGINYTFKPRIKNDLPPK